MTVVHYDAADAAMVVERLRRDGIEATHYPHLGSGGFRAIRDNPPDAILIDLMRMPSYGKAVGAMLREQKGTRAIPLVFLEGDPEKTARVRELLPDAGYTSLAGAAAALRRAARRPVAEPVVPAVKTSVAAKLKIGSGCEIALLGAPAGVDALLGPLPDGARLRRNARDGDVVLLFAKSAAALGRELPRLAGSLPRVFWVLWPKRASGAASDLTFPRINEMCAPLGLVGYKTCAVDETWSAVAVSRRRSAKTGRRPEL